MNGTSDMPTTGGQPGQMTEGPGYLYTDNSLLSKCCSFCHCQSQETLCPFASSQYLKWQITGKRWHLAGCSCLCFLSTRITQSNLLSLYALPAIVHWRWNGFKCLVFSWAWLLTVHQTVIFRSSGPPWQSELKGPTAQLVHEEQVGILG